LSRLVPQSRQDPSTSQRGTQKKCVREKAAPLRSG